MSLYRFLCPREANAIALCLSSLRLTNSPFHDMLVAGMRAGTSCTIAEDRRPGVSRRSARAQDVGSRLPSVGAIS